MTVAVRKRLEIAPMLHAELIAENSKINRVVCIYVPIENLIGTKIFQLRKMTHGNIFVQKLAS